MDPGGDAKRETMHSIAENAIFGDEKSMVQASNGLQSKKLSGDGVGHRSKVSTRAVLHTICYLLWCRAMTSLERDAVRSFSEEYHTVEAAEHGARQCFKFLVLSAFLQGVGCSLLQPFMFAQVRLAEN